MAVVKATSEDIKLLARLLRAEAEGEGELGMLLVANVGVNRVRGNCIDFKNIRTISQMVFQSPGGFEATQKGYFYQKARDSKLNWRGVQLMVNVSILHLILCGTFALPAAVRQHGGING